MERVTPQKSSVPGFGCERPSSVPSPSKLTSTPILPKPNLDHLKSSASLSTKRESRRSRLPLRNGGIADDSPSFGDDDEDNNDEDNESRLWKRRYNATSASLHSSFLHHSSHPLSPIKSLAPQSRVFARPRLDRASVVSFLPSSSQQQRRPRQLSALYDDKNKLEYLEQCFDVEAKIGEGSFGEVFKARFRDDGKYYAIKRSRGAFRGTSDRKEKLGEVAKLEKMEPHPNCVQFFLAWEEKKHLYIQTELCMTSLQQFVAVEGMDDRLPETRVWGVLLDLLRGVKHLHDSDLIHFDIKLDNIFVSRLDDGRFICKLGDFGNARHEDSANLQEAQEGDSKYLAPEILGGVFSKAADVFSLGMTILEVATGLDPPSHGDGWHLLRGGDWQRDPVLAPLLKPISDDLRLVLNRMLDSNPRTRWTIDELLESAPVKAAERRERRYATRRRFLERIARFLRVLLLLLVTLWERIVRQPFVVVANSLFRIHLTSRSLSSSSSTSPSKITPCPRASPSSGDALGIVSRRLNVSQSKSDSSPSLKTSLGGIASENGPVAHRYYPLYGHRSSLVEAHDNGPTLCASAATYAMEDSFSDNDDVFEKLKSKSPSPSSFAARSFARSLATTSRQLIASLRPNGPSPTTGQVSPWNKFGSLRIDRSEETPGSGGGGTHNSSTSSSILAAPLNDSLSPSSEKSSLTWEVNRDNDAGGASVDESDLDPDSVRCEDRSVAYEGATPPPKRHQRRPSSQLRQNVSFSRQQHRRQSQQQTTPAHLINESPFKPPLLMSTPRQRSLDLKNEAGLEIDFREEEEFAKRGSVSGIGGGCVDDRKLNRSLPLRSSSSTPMSGSDRRSLHVDEDEDVDVDGGRLERSDGDTALLEWSRATSWETRESMEEEEETAEMVLPLVGELSSSVGPKNLLSLFESVSDDE